MWTRREWGQMCAGGLLGIATRSAGAAPLVAPSRAVPTPRLVLAVVDKPAFCQLPLTIAERLGFFAAEGVALEVMECADNGTALRAVKSGSAHLMAASYAMAVNQSARGSYFTSILLQGLAPQMVFGMSQRTMEGRHPLTDLRGRRIGVTAWGSASHRIAQMALERASVRPNEVDFVPMASPSAVLTAFRAGQLDALCYNDPVITQLEQSGELRVVVDTRTARASAELFGGPLPTTCIAAPTAWVAARGDECQAVANAMVRALKWLQTAGPSDITKAVPESYFQGDRALYLAAFDRVREAWAPDGVMPEAGPPTLLRWLAQFEDAPSLPRTGLTGTYTNRFAAKAKARFRA